MGVGDEDEEEEKNVNKEFELYDIEAVGNLVFPVDGQPQTITKQIQETLKIQHIVPDISTKKWKLKFKVEDSSTATDKVTHTWVKVNCLKDDKD